ncbi:hypothetical protein L6164_007111 [Bauhinia variegata]|uniref:Uncharacterized protein n=1 Tax=Bauhinia variegata TaxID=167791 RepID=A0ACB9PVP4_BAUVA|nr:hypothetical protein L6164_007111 [Bauhinia variegata]
MTTSASHGRLRTILYDSDGLTGHQINNHAPVNRSHLIHQALVPVSLKLKDTEVRAYRTDPVQVRSCSLFFSVLLYAAILYLLHSMWDLFN